MSLTNPTKANAERWLDRHLGATIATVQTDGEFTWAPQNRTLSKQFNHMWLLDGSSVRLTAQHFVVRITADSLVLAWNGEDGHLIHTTTYTVVTP